jgi:hypothetical protein
MQEEEATGVERVEHTVRKKNVRPLLFRDKWEEM